MKSQKKLYFFLFLSAANLLIALYALLSNNFEALIISVIGFLASSTSVLSELGK